METARKQPWQNKTAVLFPFVWISLGKSRMCLPSGQISTGLMLHEKAVMVSIWHSTRDSWIVPSLHHHSLSQKGTSGACLAQTPQLKIQQVVQNHKQVDFKYLTGQSTTSPGKRVSLFQCSDSLCSKMLSLCWTFSSKVNHPSSQLLSVCPSMYSLNHFCALCPSVSVSPLLLERKDLDTEL